MHSKLDKFIFHKASWFCNFFQLISKSSLPIHFPCLWIFRRLWSCTRSKQELSLMNKYLQLPTWIPKAEADFFESCTGNSQDLILLGLKRVLEQQLLLIRHVWNPEQHLRALWQNWVGLFVLHNSNHSTCAIRIHLFNSTWCPSCNSCNSLM